MLTQMRALNYLKKKIYENNLIILSNFIKNF